MKKTVFAMIAAIVFGVLIGCQDRDDKVVKNDPANTTMVELEPGTGSKTARQFVSGGPNGEQDFRQQAADVIEQSGESDGEGVNIGRSWITDRLNDATDSGSAIAGNASEWASEMFQSLKDQGLTSADNARQWLTDDIRNMNALNYKIIKVSLDDLAAVEEQLNELGAQRWECFHAVDQEEETVLFFKKNRRSILRNIPARDLMKLIPLMENSDGE